MKEIFEFRINYDYATRLFSANEGKNLGQSVKVVRITKEDPRFFQIPLLDKEVNEKFNRSFYYSWNVYYKYTKKEIESASLFKVSIGTVFEPAGEECGTAYDESFSCEVCGSNRKQIGPLKLKKGSTPKKDIARTIAGEVIVSEKWKDTFLIHSFKGLTFEPVILGKDASNIYQPKITSPEVSLSERTIAGINPFDLSESCEGEIYKCPKGHTLGLNILSETFVENSKAFTQFDFFASKQKIGVKRGLLRPQPLYLCSPAFKRMVEKEDLAGLTFEVAHIEK